MVKGNDKKKKEPVLTEIARGKVDTMPLLSNEHFEASVTADALVPLVEIDVGTPPIVISLHLSINTPVLSSEQEATCNILTVAVEGLLSIPEAWAVQSAGMSDGLRN